VKSHRLRSGLGLLREVTVAVIIAAIALLRILGLCPPRPLGLLWATAAPRALLGLDGVPLVRGTFFAAGAFFGTRPFGFGCLARGFPLRLGPPAKAKFSLDIQVARPG
jgi:hypothetical protein